VLPAEESGEKGAAAVKTKTMVEEGNWAFIEPAEWRRGSDGVRVVHLRVPGERVEFAWVVRLPSEPRKEDDQVRPDEMAWGDAAVARGMCDLGKVPGVLPAVE
jgi:hypothetical protein